MPRFSNVISVNALIVLGDPGDNGVAEAMRLQPGELLHIKYPLAKLGDDVIFFVYVSFVLPTLEGFMFVVSF